MAKNKLTKYVDEDHDEPRKLEYESIVKIIKYLTGIIHEVTSKKISLDEAIAIHRLIGQDYFDPNGRPYYVDSHAIDNLTGLAKRGLAAIERRIKRNKLKGTSKCATTTSSTKRKVSKRKNV